MLNEVIWNLHYKMATQTKISIKWVFSLESIERY